jgi:hypothetical protein
MVRNDTKQGNYTAICGLYFAWTPYTDVRYKGVVNVSNCPCKI